MPRWLSIAKIALAVAAGTPAVAVAPQAKPIPERVPEHEQRYLLQQYLQTAAETELNEKETEQITCPDSGCAEKPVIPTS